MRPEAVAAVILPIPHKRLDIVISGLRYSPYQNCQLTGTQA
jgi:hypothetical protein